MLRSVNMLILNEYDDDDGDDIAVWYLRWYRVTQVPGWSQWRDVCGNSLYICRQHMTLWPSLDRELFS